MSYSWAIYSPIFIALLRDLAEVVETLDVSTLVPFPSFDGSRFRELLDEEMGYPTGAQAST